MLSDRLLRNCILLSVLLHLIFMVLASMIRWTPHRADNVMVVDLADMPRSTEFLRPQPGIVEGARPKPPPPPPVPDHQLRRRRAKACFPEWL